MVWAGSPFAQRIEFVTGQPVGDISFQLLGNNGSSVLTSGDIQPAAGSVSHLLVIDAEHNTCALPLFENRTLVWSYTTSENVVSGRVAYRVNHPVPFAVSADGVRAKLGLDPHELTDDHIDLVAAYAEFAALVPEDGLTSASLAGDRSTLLCLNAIEALAALAILPSVQMLAAQREIGANSQWARFSRIDWKLIAADLQSQVARARGVLDSSFDATGANVVVFQTAPASPDALTGEEA